MGLVSIPLVRTVRRLVDVTTVVSPASRLRGGSELDTRRAFLEASGRRVRGERSIVEEMAMNVVREPQSVFRVIPEPIVDLARFAGEVDADTRVRNALENTFGVPAEEAPPLPGSTSTGSVPVVVVPVVISAVEVHQHVVDEIVDIEVVRERQVASVVRTDRTNERKHLTPGSCVTVDRVARVERVVFFLLAAHVVRGEGSARALDEVEDSPVETVDVEIHVVAMSRRLAHVRDRVLRPLVADHHSATPLPAVPVDPRVVVVSTQNQCIETLDGRVREERVTQARRSVVALEQQAKRVLGRAIRVATGATENSHAAVNLEALAAIGVDQLGGASALPADAFSRRVRVDSARTEQIVDVRNDGHHGQRDESFTNALGRARDAHDLGIHLVVDTRSRSPAVRKTRGSPWLGEHVLGKDVRVRLDARRKEPVAQTDRAKRHGRSKCGAGDLDRLGIDEAVSGCRLAAVESVTDFDAWSTRSDLERERLHEDTAFRGEGQVLDERREHDVVVHVAGSRRREVADVSGTRETVGMIRALVGKLVEQRERGGAVIRT